MNISVVISTRNRAASLERTLASVKGLADEIIVIDNESEDETAAVAKKFRAKVFTRPNNLMLNVNKNFGFSKATGDWILCLDDDEELTLELKKEMQDAVRNTKDIVGYWVPRRNIIFGRWIEHGIWWPDRQLRLFKRGMGTYKEQHVHEYIEVVGRTENLSHPYIHHNYDSLSQYLEKMQHIYTANEVDKYVKLGYRIHWYDAVRFPLSDFLKLYFAQSGYKDGLHGLVLAMLQAFYSFIIFVKLWEREKFLPREVGLPSVIREFIRSAQEMRYWMRTATMSESTDFLSRVWHRLLRRLGV